MLGGTVYIYIYMLIYTYIYMLIYIYIYIYIYINRVLPRMMLVVVKNILGRS